MSVSFVPRTLSSQRRVLRPSGEEGREHCLPIAMCLFALVMLTRILRFSHLSFSFLSFLLFSFELVEIGGKIN